MPDGAHKKTDALLYHLERRLNRLYANAAQEIRKQTSPLLEKIYLYDENATQKKRLDYANQHGKKEIVHTVTKNIVSANEQAVNSINRQQLENYQLNFVDACNEVIKQIRNSMDKGGD